MNYGHRGKENRGLIECSRLQDEVLLQRIDALRKGALNEIYEDRIPKTIKDLQTKLERSEKDITEGKVYTQSEVELHFTKQALVIWSNEAVVDLEIIHDSPD